MMWSVSNSHVYNNECIGKEEEQSMYNTEYIRKEQNIQLFFYAVDKRFGKLSRKMCAKEYHATYGKFADTFHNLKISCKIKKTLKYFRKKPCLWSDQFGTFSIQVCVQLPMFQSNLKSTFLLLRLEECQLHLPHRSTQTHGLINSKSHADQKFIYFVAFTGFFRSFIEGLVQL